VTVPEDNKNSEDNSKNSEDKNSDDNCAHNNNHSNNNHSNNRKQNNSQAPNQNLHSSSFRQALKSSPFLASSSRMAFEPRGIDAYDDIRNRSETKRELSDSEKRGREGDSGKNSGGSRESKSDKLYESRSINRNAREGVYGSGSGVTSNRERSASAKRALDRLVRSNMADRASERANANDRANASPLKSARSYHSNASPLRSGRERDRTDRTDRDVRDREVRDILNSRAYTSAAISAGASAMIDSRNATRNATSSPDRQAGDRQSRTPKTDKFSALLLGGGVSERVAMSQANSKIGGAVRETRNRRSLSRGVDMFDRVEGSHSSDVELRNAGDVSDSSRSQPAIGGNGISRSASERNLSNSDRRGAATGSDNLHNTTDLLFATRNKIRNTNANTASNFDPDFFKRTIPAVAGLQSPQTSDEIIDNLRGTPARMKYAGTVDKYVKRLQNLIEETLYNNPRVSDAVRNYEYLLENIS
jgi:hypothetical protein